MSRGQAVLALLKLGSLLHVSSRLHGRAIDALKGNENVNFATLKLSLGLSSGNTAKILRAQSPGIRCFLLITGLKLWNTNDDIGDVLYEMLRQSGVYQTTPASAQQLGRVTDVLSGHANLLLQEAIQQLTDIGTALAKSSAWSQAASGLMDTLAPCTLAEVLIKLFTALTNNDVQKITDRKSVV